MENPAVLGASMIRIGKFFTGMIVALLLLAGCTITNRYDGYSGRVIDAGTKKPIEGAAVLVVYNTEQYGLAGAVRYFADAQEVLTDRNGEFRIPAKRIITFRVLSGWEQYPHFTIFKPGYGCYPNHKDVTPMFEPNGALPAEQYVIIQLPNVQSEPRPVRLENYGCYPSPSVPQTAYKKLLNLINREAVSLGLEPDKEPKEGK
jgi:hypothetical protein